MSTLDNIPVCPACAGLGVVNSRVMPARDDLHAWAWMPADPVETRREDAIVSLLKTIDARLKQIEENQHRHYS